MFGCYCINPKLVLDEKYATNKEDYPENFHKMIWGAIVNIVKKGGAETITPLEIETEIIMTPGAESLWNKNNGYEYIEDAINIAQDEIRNVGKHRDDVRKYSIVRNAFEELKLDISDIYNEENDSIMERFNEYNSSDLLRVIYTRFNDFKEKWKSAFGDNYSFKVGAEAKSLKEMYKKQENTYGYPFQSGYLTTVFRGMRKRKFIIRSSISGGSKSRQAMADAVNIGCNRLYDWSKGEWISTGRAEPVLFISTELSKEEVDSCIMAHISGVDQDRIEAWEDITEKEEQIIDESAKIMEEECLIYGEYMPDFTIDTIVEQIEKYVINYKIGYCFFDYINDSPSLYSYYYEKTKTRLRTDQILFLFSNSLKIACNNFNIFLGSSTQLNDSYKDDANKDASALKGSKAIIEKADGGILMLPATPKDIKKLDPIIKSKGGFANKVPNMAYYIFKNRGGKWKAIIIWTKINLGTMRETDCFVTNYGYEPILDIKRTLEEFSFDDVEDYEIKELPDVQGTDLATELSK